MGRKKETLPPPLPDNKLARAIVTIATAYSPDNLFRWAVERYLSGFGVQVHDTMPAEAMSDVGYIMDIYTGLVRSAEPLTDILGPARIDLAPYWPEQDQITAYTPQPVADLIAQSRFATLTARNSAITDPACGNGTVLLSLLRVLYGQLGREGLNNWTITALDKDELSVRVCALQILVNAAIYDVAPGQFVAKLSKPIKDKGSDKVVAELRYFEASKQHEVVAAGLNQFAGSAQPLLI
jgi:type I restriction-modification system DNA methylase subunit